MSSKNRHVCPNCGTDMWGNHCKLRCPKCGLFEDCSDGIGANMNFDETEKND